MPKISDNLAITLVIFGIVGGTFGAIQIFPTNDDLNSVHAEVKFVSEKLDKKILFDDLKEYQKLVFMYDEKYGEGCEGCPPEVMETYRVLKQKIQEIKAELGLDGGGLG